MNVLACEIQLRVSRKPLQPNTPELLTPQKGPCWGLRGGLEPARHENLKSLGCPRSKGTWPTSSHGSKALRVLTTSPHVKVQP